MVEGNRLAVRKKWAEILNSLLQFDASDIVDYLIGLESEAHVTSYLESILDVVQPSHRRAMVAMVSAGFPNSRYAGPVTAQKSQIKGIPAEGAAKMAPGTGGRKEPSKANSKGKAKQQQSHGSPAASAWPTHRQEGSQRQLQPQPQAGWKTSKPGRAKQEKTKDAKGARSTEKTGRNSSALSAESKGQSAAKGTSKKKRAVPVSAAALEKQVDPGRRLCECQAQRHSLLTNCLNCGLVVCAQQGLGPCLYCQSPLDLGGLNNDGLKSQALGNPASARQASPGLQKALEAKNKLLQFEAERAQRTRVIDDQNDYFELDNRWLSIEERERRRQAEAALQEAKAQARNTLTITLDLAGRRVIQEDTTKDIDETAFLSEPAPDAEPVPENSLYGLLHNTSLREAPTYVGSLASISQAQSQDGQDMDTDKDLQTVPCVQTEGLGQLGDEGMCLSMHQPWASLLVAGIKKVEGRVWYTAHRGRLWIAAAAKEPEADLVSAVEQQYRDLSGGPVEFPVYPTSCLLGYVDVDDCLTQEEYIAKCAGQPEESQSPYVFMCSNPHFLPIKFSIKGKHKIWRLDPLLHRAARRSLMDSKLQST